MPRTAPNHPLTLFALYFALSGVVGAVIAYPLWLLTGFEFEKVLSRSAILAAALLMLPLVRWLSLSWSEIGFDRPRWSSFLSYWMLGYALILPPAIVFVLVDFRVFDVRVLDEGSEVLRVAFMGIVSGVLVGIFEETLFRGVLLSLWQRAYPAFAVIGSSLVYAAVHFVEAPEGVVAPQWWSGLDQLARAFAPLADPVAYWDSFLGLTLLGIGLCWVRQRTGSLWPAIALHGAFVMFLKLYKDITIRDIDVPAAWLVGSYDNFVGVLTSVWLLLVFVGLYGLSRARS